MRLVHSLPVMVSTAMGDNTPLPELVETSKTFHET